MSESKKYTEYNVIVRAFPTSVAYTIFDRARRKKNPDFLPQPKEKHGVSLEELEEMFGKVEVIPCAQEEPRKISEILARAKHSRNVSNARTKKRIVDLCRANEWEYFVTLTFDPAKVNSQDFGEVSRKLQTWLKSARGKCADLRYIFVFELTKNGAFHVHGLMSNCAGLDFQESGHRDSKGRKIYNIGAYRFGFTTATKVQEQERVQKYLIKYVTKDLLERVVGKGKKLYWASRNLARPKVAHYNYSASAIRDLRQCADYEKVVTYQRGAEKEERVMYIEVKREK